MLCFSVCNLFLFPRNSDARGLRCIALGCAVLPEGFAVVPEGFAVVPLGCAV